MLFYCEAKSNNSAVLDVHNLEELKQWWLELDISPWISEDQRSLIEIKNLKIVKYRGLREGLWYKIPDNFWSEFKFDLEKFSYAQENRSLLFRLSVNYEGIDNIDFVSYRTDNLEE
ncbi:hypothetical protein [Solibacillus isronensis]|uniref:hypothetical protein n=1 Tax=Solibacillus isronensis TaxID=412383 RepID=UPI00203B0BEF|nr:hypothetical protein [Solibacillus isronensis]MCM3722472.1 hypothetical protein [Solibacillus isronensis]